jgi:hypothetical protein
MTAFGTCVGTVRRSVCVCNSSRARVCATDTCAFALVTGRSPICAAGATWTLVIASAQWAARASHTTVIDATGAIYVIGGLGGIGDTYYNDVWVSTDGGADRTRGVLDEYLRVFEGYFVVHRGTPWYSAAMQGYCPGTSGLLEGYSDGASGRLHARKRAKLEGCASALEGVLCGVLCRGGLGGIL